MHPGPGVKTFYVSCSEEHRELARSVGESLKSLGLEWSGGYTWPDRFEATPENEREWGVYAAMDITAAVSADLFVLLVTGPSFGAGAEFGARHQVGKRIDVVVPENQNGQPDLEAKAEMLGHPFFRLPTCRQWLEMDDFYCWVRRVETALR